MPQSISLVDLLAKITAAPPTPVGSSVVGPVESEIGGLYLRIFPFPNSPNTFLRVPTAAIVGPIVELDPAERAALGFAGRDAYRLIIQAGSDIEVCSKLKLIDAPAIEQIEELFLSLGEELELGDYEPQGQDKCPARANV